MAKKGKKYNNARTLIEQKEYALEDAVSLLKKMSFVQFDESVDIAMSLGIDPKHSDQMVRGTVALPAGTGKTVRVCVIAGGEKVKEAEEAGADAVGGDDLIEKISKGWVDFDVLIATPDMMRGVGKLGRTLGPKGLMPNPKSGTVTFDVKKAVDEIKSGRIEFRVDKTSNIHSVVGKLSFEDDQLIANVKAFVQAIVQAKPPAAKGRYIKTMSLSTTMGPSLKLSDSILDK